MANWEMIAKSLSEAGKSAAMGLVDKNRQALANYYNIQQENRANEQEQIRFERNRAAEMKDRKELMEKESELAQANAHIKLEDEAELTKWGNDPDLRHYAENLKLQADTFGDPVARASYEGLGKLMGVINSGKLETELDSDMQTALNALPQETQQSLRTAISNNYNKRLQNQQVATMIEYYKWLMNPRTKDAEWAKLSWEQLQDLKDKRTDLFNLIQARESDKDFMLGRDVARKYGINPNEDPRKNPNWEKLTTDPKAKDAGLLLSYLDRWKQVAALKNILGEINEGLYQRDPMTDPERYLRDLKTAEDRRKGIFPLPTQSPERAAMVQTVTQQVSQEPPAERPVWKKFFVDKVGGFAADTFLDIRENIQHSEEFREFKKQIEARYGISPKKIEILTNPQGLLKEGPERIGTIFYDPHKGILVEVVADPMGGNSIALAPLPEIGKK